MHNYYICDECRRPVIEEETHIVLHDLRTLRKNQYYCSACFASINYDKILANEKKINASKTSAKK